MRTAFEKFKGFASSQRAVPWVFLVVAILAYGLFAWWLGFYWDDLPMSWIRYELGPEAMTVYFSTSRPVWGYVYQITTRLLPQVPIYWQVFSILWRWLGVVLLWKLILELFPGRHRLAFFTGVFFLLYPGFNLQWVSYLTTHFYIVLCIFLLSLLLTIHALRKPHRYWALTIPAMILSLLNIWMMEYFYFLEFIRFFLILYVLYQTQTGERFILIVRRAFLHWLPYLSVFLLNVFYRAFIFTNVAYQNVLLADLKADPLKTLLVLVQQVLSDLWLVSVGAWAQVFQIPNPQVDGPLTTALFVFITLLAGAFVFIFVKSFLQQDEENKTPNFALWAMGIGFVAMIFGGGPYWLASLELSLAFPASRFTLSFMLGVSLLMAGVVELLPVRVRLIVAGILVAFAAGRQVMASDIFRRDWQAQKNLFWQMTWRAPGIKPNTVVLMNEELSLYADNSISAPLNWIYSPKQDAQDIEYVLFYPTNRLGKTLPALEPGLPVNFTYISGDFNGNTSDALAFYYDPPACLRLLESFDKDNRFILDESLMREASTLSSTDRITAEPTSVMPSIYGPEPEHGWCYYFQKADLARQLGDWEEVVNLGNKAFKLDDHPNNPVERFVFIEGYAHVGDWKRAIQLSKESYRVSKEYVGPLLCQLWERIEAESAQSPERSEVLVEVRGSFECNP